ncbi:MAG: UDP-glucose--hexose-1-phosphate uridylyltransferase [Bryobacterales bacterium]|nr:UDP-glucose--hexose-1-phosphate uridylyltransferase [Bryobacterales bacterium]
MLDLSAHPHRRRNALTGEWVLVSPHRTSRPWQGQVEKAVPPISAAYDPDCYLCPGNARAGGNRNPAYTETFVFENDFAALTPDSPRESYDKDGLLRADGESGICRVVCYSPRHDLTLARLSLPALERVIETWIEQTVELGSQPAIQNVQIFENRGEMMGASNPHPHGQIWASSILPNEISKELANLTAWFAAHEQTLLSDYLRLELECGDRIVSVNDHFATLVPFWAVWPFETILVSRRPISSLPEMDAKERKSLAGILNETLTRYDNLFQTSFPYSMGFHQAPTDGAKHPEWHLHAHFYPPLLRSATIRKFMVGYELLGMPQRDITAESSAARLRETSTVHYLDRG